jgi:hypothetical protein
VITGGFLLAVAVLSAPDLRLRRLLPSARRRGRDLGGAEAA